MSLKTGYPQNSNFSREHVGKHIFQSTGSNRVHTCFPTNPHGSHFEHQVVNGNFQAGNDCSFLCGKGLNHLVPHKMGWFHYQNGTVYSPAVVPKVWRICLIRSHTADGLNEITTWKMSKISRNVMEIFQKSIKIIPYDLHWFTVVSKRFHGKFLQPTFVRRRIREIVTEAVDKLSRFVFL